MEDKIAESQEALTKGSWKDFFSVDKMMDWGMNLAAILIIILIGLILLKIILRITDRGLKKSTADPILYTFVRNVIKVAAAIVLITMCLGVLGIQVHTIVAVIGAAGAAIALALKDSLANIAGGVDRKSVV